MMSMFTRRTVAYILDFFVVSAFMWIIAFIISLLTSWQLSNDIYNYFIYITPILIMLYFVYCEVNKGATIGKAIMYLKVKSSNGRKINIQQAILRNISKIYWIPIIFDWAIGKILKSEDRFLNGLTSTKVIEENH